MLAIGVFSSCVILLIKSFLISVSFFCLNTSTSVMMKVMSSTKVNTTDGMAKRTDEKM